MDNASKALIMAGAILIAVMLISLGVLLYNRAADVANSSVSTIDSIGAAAFNEQFTQFCGTGVSASTAKTLINKVKATAGGEHSVSLKNDSNGITSVSNVTTTKTSGSAKVPQTYKVEDVTYDANGYLTDIRITKE